MNVIENNFINRTIFGKFKIIKLIGIGSHSRVFLSKNIKNNNQLLACKIQKKIDSRESLEKEAFYLFQLKGIGIPKIISYGHYGQYNILVEELLGKTLGELFIENKKQPKVIRLKDWAMTAIQLIERIQFIHSNYLLHLDIKPENCLIGTTDMSLIYFIDFGMAKKYRSSRTGNHVKFAKKSFFKGNIKYSSFNTMKGIEPSRRDDLESIGYMLIYLYHQQLPWSNLNDINHYELAKKIYFKKKTTPMETLCKDLPQEMTEYMLYVKSLKFEEEPNYNYLKKLFELVLIRINKLNDMIFSWINLPLISRINKNNYKNRTVKRNSPFIRIFKTLKLISPEDLGNTQQTYTVNDGMLDFHENELKNIQCDKKIFSTKYTPAQSKEIKIVKIDNKKNSNNKLSRNIFLKKSPKISPIKDLEKNCFTINDCAQSNNNLEKNIHYKSLMNNNIKRCISVNHHIPNTFNISKINNTNISINNNIIINNCDSQKKNIFIHRKSDANKRRPIITTQNNKLIFSLPLEFKANQFYNFK